MTDYIDIDAVTSRPDLQRALAAHNDRVAERQERRRRDLGSVAGVTAIGAYVVQLIKGEQPDAAQRISGLADARKERGADGCVLEYAEGAPEPMTQQTKPATEEQTAPQLGSQLRQEGAE